MRRLIIPALLALGACSTVPEHRPAIIRVETPAPAPVPVELPPQGPQLSDQPSAAIRTIFNEAGCGTVDFFYSEYSNGRPYVTHARGPDWMSKDLVQRCKWVRDSLLLSEWNERDRLNQQKRDEMSKKLDALTQGFSK